MSPRTRKSGDGALYYDKKRDLWIGVFDNGTKPDGSRKQVRVSSRSQTKAREKMDAKKAEIKANYGEPFSNQTVAEWGEYWLKEIQQPKMKPGPWRSYSSMWKNWILKPIGKLKVKEVRPSDLRRIYDNIARADKSDATRLKAHVVMSSMFEAARLEGVTGVNVAKNIRPPKVIRGDRAARSTFEPDVTLRILQEALNHRHPTKWIVSLYAGIRQGERLGATIDSVDLVRGVFTVQWNLVEGNYEHGCGGTCGKRAAGWCPSKRLIIPQGIVHRILRGRLMLVPPKSGEARSFSLPPTLVDLLEKHIAELSLQDNPHSLLWPAADGRPMSSRDDQAEWKALIAAAGVKDESITSYWARHTAISDLSASGVTDRAIGDMVGHRSPGVTGNYTHLSRQDSIDAMKKLEERRNATPATK